MSCKSGGERGCVGGRVCTNHTEVSTRVCAAVKPTKCVATKALRSQVSRGVVHGRDDARARTRAKDTPRFKRSGAASARCDICDIFARLNVSHEPRAVQLRNAPLVVRFSSRPESGKSLFLQRRPWPTQQGANPRPRWATQPAAAHTPSFRAKNGQSVSRIVRMMTNCFVF